MKPTHLIVAAALAIASAASYATCQNGGSNWPTCTPPATPSAPSTSTNTLTGSSSATSNAEASAGASSSLSGTLSAAGGSGGNGGSASLSDFSRQNMYVLPAPVSAAPLPAGLCPQGDSMSIGILWNLISYSVSSTRSEMECLDKVLASVRAAPTVQVIQAPTLPPAASAPPAAKATKRKVAAKQPSACVRASTSASTATNRQGPCQGV